MDMDIPSNVKEVGGVAAVEREDVHCGHGETRAINQAANRTVKLDEIEIRLLGLNFRRLLLCDVAQGEDVLLTEFRVVVEPELGIHAKEQISAQSNE